MSDDDQPQVERQIHQRLSGSDPAILNFNKRDKYYGTTVADHIRTISGELPIDAVGLWQIAAAGSTWFDLQGDELTEFFRRCVVALLEHGAKPVVGVWEPVGTYYYWLLQPQYGKDTTEFAGAVIAEWLSTDGQTADPGGLWFALPKLYETELKTQ